MNFMRFSKSLLLSMLLGVALGTGYMTSLRFIGPVGISEVLFFVLIFVLLLNNKFVIFVCRGGKLSSFLKLYLTFSFFVVMPLVTAVVSFFSEYSGMIFPEYVFSFIGGLLLSFLVCEAINKNQLNMRVVVFWFLVVFVFSNALAIMFGYGFEASRYRGFSDNPNQLLFYVSSLSLLLGVYDRVLFWVSAIPLVYIGFISGSDAYFLALVASGLCFAFVKAFYINRLGFWGNFLFFAIFLVSILILFKDYYVEALLSTWNAADEGGSRAYLMINAIKASIYSPVFGWGSGSFSGVFAPFEGREAHNNILDLSMQFGFGVPLAIYSVIVAAMVKALRSKEHLVFALMVGFVISGLFHFSARHFVFWVEFGVFFYYAFSAGSYTRRQVSRKKAGKNICAG